MAYSYKRQISVDATKCGSSDSTSFPVLISGTYSYLKTVGNSGNIQNTVSSNGQTIPADLQFYSDQALTAALPFEIASYTATSGQIEAWVQVSTLSHTTNTSFYMGFGDASITTDQSGFGSGTKPWDTNFKGVWHFPDGTTLTAKDSTGTGDGSLVNAPTATTGQMGGGAHFASGSTQSISIAGDPAGLKITGTMTVSFWAKFTDGNVYGYVNKNDDSQSRNFGTWTNGTGSLMQIWQSPNTSAFYGLSHAVPSNAMHHWVFVVDPSSPSTTAHGYLDGVADTGFSVWINTWSGTTLNNPTLNWTFGNKSNGSWPATADIDEVRISNSIRSASWVTAEYNNQSSPSTFYTISTVSSNAGATTFNNYQFVKVGSGDADQTTNPGIISVSERIR